MNCPECRSHLPDYLEKVVTPVLQREMRAHLETCRSCATDLRELRIVLARLRDVSAVAAPPGLAASVTARLLSASPAADRPAPKSRTTSRTDERRGERAWSWSRLAAAGLMIAAASFVAGHVVSRGPSDETLAALDAARRQVRSLEMQLGDTRTRLVEENSVLRREVMSVKGTLDQWKTERASDVRSERETRQALDRRLREAASEIETQRATLAALQARLDAAIEARNAAVTEKKDALTRALAAESSAAEARNELASVERLRTATSAWRDAAIGTDGEYREVPPVLLVRDGDMLRLKTRGALEDVGPELFTLAENDADAEIADLALTTLEARLAPFAPAEEAEDTDRSPGGKTGLVDWFNRQVGFVDIVAEETAAGTTDRRARLARLRRVWQERFPGP